MNANARCLTLDESKGRILALFVTEGMSHFHTMATEKDLVDLVESINVALSEFRSAEPHG